MNRKLKEKIVSLGLMSFVGLSLMVGGVNIAHADVANVANGSDSQTEQANVQLIAEGDNSSNTEKSAEETNNQGTNSESTSNQSNQTNQNGSNTSQKPSTKEVEQDVKIVAPSSVTGQKTDGQGTVTDFSTSASKSFFTIQDNEGNVFYLIIDMEKTENNVYFVSDVNKSTLEQGGNNNMPPVNQTQQQQVASPEQQVTSPEEQANPQQADESNSSFLMVVLIGFVAVVGGYYFLVFKKKKDGNEPNEAEDTDFSDSLDDEDDFLSNDSEGE